jgi:hypothetical protein
MASIYSPLYETGQRSGGTSGAEVSDLRPEQAYDTDLRRLDPEERAAASSLNNQQTRVARFTRAAKSAAAYKQRADIADPQIRGKTPRTPLGSDGTVIPNLGERFGRGGGTNYANKPQGQFGKPFG